MNKEKIIRGASEILDIPENDEMLNESFMLFENENYGTNLSDEVLIWGLVAEHAFATGMFETWKEYQVKFNQEILKGGK